MKFLIIYLIFCVNAFFSPRVVVHVVLMQILDCFIDIFHYLFFNIIFKKVNFFVVDVPIGIQDLHFSWSSIKCSYLHFVVAFE